MAKAPEAFRTISEVSAWLNTPAHVLRFWESKFTQVRPVKRAGGRRYYRPEDVALLGAIKDLLHEQGMTIKGVQKMLREQGVKDVSARSPVPDWAQPVEDVIAAQEAAPVGEKVPAPDPEDLRSEAEQAAMAFSFAAHDVTPERDTLLARIHRTDKEYLRSMSPKLRPFIARLTDLRNRMNEAASAS